MLLVTSGWGDASCLCGRTGARFAREKQVLRCAQNDNSKSKSKSKGKSKSKSKGKGTAGLSTSHHKDKGVLLRSR
jgi:hypothetical protein